MTGQISRANRFSLAILVIVWALVYLASCRYPPALLDDADTVHAEAAREMVQRGDWVTLHANGIRYLEKAPLMYWGVAICYKLFGVSEFATRLPIALAVLALILTTYFFGKYSYGERAGFYSAMILGTSVGIYLFTRVLWPDVILTLFLTLVFFCFLHSLENPQSGSAYGMYVFSALAVLTKGLIGAVFPAVIIGIYLLLTRQLQYIFQWRSLKGFLLFICIAAPWHLLAGFRNKTFFWFYFINEHFLRYIGKRYPFDYDTVPLLFFICLHLLWLFPWSIFLPLSAKYFPRTLRPKDREEQTTLLVVIWIVAIILFFSFSTRQEYYTMPVYPAFALLIGYSLARREAEISENNGSRVLLSTQQVALFVLGIFVFAAGIWAFVITAHTKTPGDIASALGRNPQEYALSLGHVLDLTPQSLAYLRLPLIGTAIAFLLGTSTALVFRLKRHHVAANVSLTVLMVFFFYFAHMALIEFEPYLSSRTLAETINRSYKEGELIIINGEYEGGSSLNFYTGKTVYILNGRSANLEYGSYFPDAPQIFLKNVDLARMWNQTRRVYLFTDSTQLETLRTVVNDPVYRIAESGGKWILSNHQ